MIYKLALNETKVDNKKYKSNPKASINLTQIQPKAALNQKTKSLPIYEVSWMAIKVFNDTQRQKLIENFRFTKKRDDWHTKTQKKSLIVL